MSASTIAASVLLQMQVTETFVEDFITTDNTIQESAPGTSTSLNASTSPAATKYAAYEVNLSTGTLTLDMTALTGRNGGTVTGNTLKLQMLMFRNKSTNANKMSVATGASNGYQLDNATDMGLVYMAPGQAVFFDLAGASQTVGSGHKTFDIVGTGSQTLQLFMVFG